MDSLLVVHKVHGVGFSYFDKSGIIYSNGFGFSNIDNRIKVDTTTVFQAASISKVICGIAVLKLVQENRIELDSNINNYLSSWKLDNPYDNYITPRNLLNHRAGINVGGFDGYSDDDKPLKSVVSILNADKGINSPKIEVKNEPNSEYQYSGGGYMILQQMIEDVTNLSYADFVRQEIFSKIGMESSFYTYPSDSMNCSFGYYYNEKRVKNGWHTYPEQAAAGLWTTPNDLSRLLIEVLHTCNGESNQILSADFMKIFVSGNTGLRIVENENDSLIGFSGRNEGFLCQMVASLKNNCGVVIMTNSDYSGGLIRDMYKVLNKQKQ